MRGWRVRLVLVPGFRPGLVVAPLRGAERRIGASHNWGTSCEGTRAPLRGAPAPSRRSTAAILGTVTVSSFNGPETCISRYPGSIGAALHPKLSKPLKAGPSSGPDGDRASWDEGARPACSRRHPRSATERLRKAPSVSGDTGGYSPTKLVRQVHSELFLRPPVRS